MLKSFVPNLLLGATLATQLPRVAIDTETLNFVEAQSGQRIVFHGQNVVVKVPPFIPQRQPFDVIKSLTDAEIVEMKAWGWNLVRLGVIWEAVETAPGVFDYEFLNEIEALIDRLAEQGIYTIIDAHQDIFSHKFCGEGVPIFYTPEWDTLEHTCYNGSVLGVVLSLGGDCRPFNDWNIQVSLESGLPVQEECAKQNFLKVHQAPEVASAFHQFWDNTNGLQDKFIDFWNVLAKKFVGNTNVLGYDMFNEPFTASMYEDMWIMLD